jgi:hypothetical protein
LDFDKLRAADDIDPITAKAMFNDSAICGVSLF